MGLTLMHLMTAMSRPEVRRHKGADCGSGSLVHRVAHGEALAAFGTTTGQDLAAVGAAHALAEAMLVGLLAIGGLERSFHCSIDSFDVIFSGFAQNASAKVLLFFDTRKSFCNFASQ